MPSQRSLVVAAWTVLALSVGLASPPARAQVDCAVETRALQALASGVEIVVAPPSTLAAGGSFEVSWRSARRLPLRSQVYVVVSIPGEVRFVAPQLQAAPRAANAVGPVPSELPGFVALPPAVRGPAGLAFGDANSRALVPLHQPGSRLSGKFDVQVFGAGPLPVAAAVVANTACGERIVGQKLEKVLDVLPGQPEIVVQDPYDIERPASIIVSPSGRYRANIFDGRYRVYDTENGAKLIDRAGHDPNFSPTSRFFAAMVGDRNNTSFEVIDLVSREVVARPTGPFIGWSHGDAFLIAGQGSWGALAVRPTLISRASAGKPARPATEGADAGDDPGDDLELRHPGSCHACASWVDDDVMLDLDNGVLALTGTFDDSNQPVYELASGARLCCKTMAQVQAFVNQSYGAAPFALARGWHSRDPIRFSHIFDPQTNPRGNGLEDQEWYKAAIPLKNQLVQSKSISPSAPQLKVAGLSGSSVVRGDWRTRVAGNGGPSSTESPQARTIAELSRLGLIAAAPLAREQIPFINSWAGQDRKLTNAATATEADYKRVEQTIKRRTDPLAARLGREVPAIAPMLKTRKSTGKYETMLPVEGLDKGQIKLAETLEGLWRWQVGGRPVWLMQLWATEGNGGIGQGMIILIEGDAAGGPRTGGRVTDLSTQLEPFWAGAYDVSDHQTQLKPHVYLDRYLVAASVVQRTIMVLDLQTRQQIALFQNVPQADLLTDVQLSTDRRHVVQFNSDGQFFVHNLARGDLSLSGRSVDDEIIVYTPEGYYWSSYEGAHFVQLRFPGLPGLFPFQQFGAILNRPDFIKWKLRDDAAKPTPPTLAPPPSLEVARVAPQDASGPIRLEVDARSTSMLAQLRIFADGQQIESIPLSAAHVRRQIEVPRAPDARWLTVQVADVAGFVSTPQALRLPPNPPSVGRLRGVLVGIDNYADPKLALRFAESDAVRLGSALENSAGKYYARAELTRITGKQATRDGILAALRQTADSALSSDTLVFSFAGHGSQDDQGRYYLSTAEFDLARLPQTGLAWSEVAQALRNTKGRVIIVLDACHAGLSGTETLGTNDDAAGALLSASQAPMLVLAASKGRQQSYENPSWGGGLFTHALVEALDNARGTYDLDHDGAIEVSELYRALKTIVARHSGGRQTPWLARKDLLGDFAIF